MDPQGVINLSLRKNTARFCSAVICLAFDSRNFSLESNLFDAYFPWNWTTILSEIAGEVARTNSFGRESNIWYQSRGAEEPDLDVEIERTFNLSKFHHKCKNPISQLHEHHQAKSSPQSHVTTLKKDANFLANKKFSSKLKTSSQKSLVAFFVKIKISFNFFQTKKLTFRRLNFL